MRRTCVERHIGLHIIITLFLFFFSSNICDYVKEGPVLLLLFPSLSLSPLIGLYFEIWSMCLLFSFVCFEWMLCCDVV